MKKILLISLFLGVTNLFAQQQQDSILVKEIPTIKNNVFQQRQDIDALTKKLNDLDNTIGRQSPNISALQDKNNTLNESIDSLTQVIQTNNQIIGTNSKNLRTNISAIDVLQNKNKSLSASLDSLIQRIQINSQNIVTNSKELGTKIQEAGQKADTQIAQLDNSVEENRLYWIIATLATLLLGGLIYWLLGKRIASSKTDVETQIRNTKASLEEESVKLDNKLVEVLETQLKLQQETAKSQPVASNEKADHSLALKVADEIVRMQKNISKMDEGTKGLKPLTKGIERIQNNFAANGYEMINLLNTEYDERKRSDVINFITDENLAEGKRIISAVIKPQVNYNGELIQRAQVDVSQN
jgi:chromosome segregation ATPase